MDSVELEEKDKSVLKYEHKLVQKQRKKLNKPKLGKNHFH